MIKPLALAAACLTMTGCSVLSIGESDYACKGYDTQGVTCMSAKEVYFATENATAISNSDFDGSDHTHQGREAQRKPSGPGEQLTTNQHNRAGQYIRHTGPTPIRTPARVMRVWVDTYEDKQGDLHTPGLVYTEVESRRWNIGKTAPSRPEKITPLGVKSSNLQRSQQAGRHADNPNVTSQSNLANASATGAVK